MVVIPHILPCTPHHAVALYVQSYRRLTQPSFRYDLHAHASLCHMFHHHHIYNVMTSPKNHNTFDASRYSRQIALPDFGTAGQQRLTDARVLIIGAGGLGSPAALYLAAAGVGHIYIADGDCVEVSNLQRQIAHTTSREDTPKALSAREAMLALNPDIEVIPLVEFITPERLDELIRDIRPDFVIDTTDSFDAKFFINDVCVASCIPCSYGAIFRYEGQLTTWIPGAPTLRDLFPEIPAPEKTQPIGPLGVVPGIIGTLQATEAIKYLTGIGELLTGTLLYVDLLTMNFNRITFTSR